MKVRSFAWLASLLAPLACTKPASECSGLPLLENDRSTNAVSLRVRLDNAMSATFEPAEVCIVVDGHAVRQDAPAAFVAAFAKHRSLEVPVSLRADVPHKIFVHVTFVARGPWDGYRFDVRSAHEIAGGPGILVARFTERNEALPERRPTIEWTDPSPDAPAAPLEAAGGRPSRSTPPGT